MFQDQDVKLFIAAFMAKNWTTPTDATAALAIADKSVEEAVAAFNAVRHIPISEFLNDFEPQP